jgi:hypothetical protein
MKPEDGCHQLQHRQALAVLEEHPTHAFPHPFERACVFRPVDHRAQRPLEVQVDGLDTLPHRQCQIHKVIVVDDGIGALCLALHIQMQPTIHVRLDSLVTDEHVTEVERHAEDLIHHGELPGAPPKQGVHPGV